MPQRDGPMGSGRHGMNPREKNEFPFRTDFMRIPAREEAPLSGSPRFRKMIVKVTTSSDDPSYFLLVWNVAITSGKLCTFREKELEKKLFSD